MNLIPRISESEWQVMRVLWARAPGTANEVVQTLAGLTHWKPKTIKTMLNRLVRKRALGFEESGRAYQYYPLVDEKRCVRAQTRSFLRLVYGGGLMPMLAAFLEDQELSGKDIADLRRILDSKEKG